MAGRRWFRDDETVAESDGVEMHSTRSLSVSSSSETDYFAKSMEVARRSADAAAV